MGDYASTTDLLDVRAIALINVPNDTLNMLIDGVEARVNSVLKAQGYPAIPATGTKDVAMIKAQVVKKAAALAFMAARSYEELPGWCVEWNNEFEDWLKALREGDVVLLEQDPTYPGKRVTTHRFRVLPLVE